MMSAIMCLLSSVVSTCVPASLPCRLSLTSSSKNVLFEFLILTTLTESIASFIVHINISPYSPGLFFLTWLGFPPSIYNTGPLSSSWFFFPAFARDGGVSGLNEQDYASYSFVIFVYLYWSGTVTVQHPIYSPTHLRSHCCSSPRGLLQRLFVPSGICHAIDLVSIPSQ